MWPCGPVRESWNSKTDRKGVPCAFVSVSLNFVMRPSAIVIIIMNTETEHMGQFRAHQGNNSEPGGCQEQVLVKVLKRNAQCPPA